MASEAAENVPSTSPEIATEIATALQPYLGCYKLAGFIGTIADKHGKFRYQNLLGESVS